MHSKVSIPFMFLTFEGYHLSAIRGIRRIDVVYVRLTVRNSYCIFNMNSSDIYI